VLVAILAALYFTRTRYLTAEGRAWTPGYCSLERPPREAPTQLHSPDAHGGLVILVVAIFGCFIVMLFWEGERGAKAVEEYNRSKVAIPPSFPPPSPPPQMNGMPQPGMPGGMGKMPGGMGKGGPGGGKFKAKPAKAPFGKGPPQDPLTEGSPKASDRPRRPEGDNDGVVPKVSTKDRIPSDEKPPQRPESSPPESLEADPSPADLLPPAREPIS